MMINFMIPFSYRPTVTYLSISCELSCLPINRCLKISNCQHQKLRKKARKLHFLSLHQAICKFTTTLQFHDIPTGGADYCAKGQWPGWAMTFGLHNHGWQHAPNIVHSFIEKLCVGTQMMFLWTGEAAKMSVWSWEMWWWACFTQQII